MKRLISIIVTLAIFTLILIPATVSAEIPIPAPDPYPKEWLIEYYEWFAWQQDSQQQYANETGHGLGVLIDYIDWAPMREAYGPYWWLPEQTQFSWVKFIDTKKGIHVISHNNKVK